MTDDTLSRFEQRLRELRSEYAAGEEQLRALDARRIQLEQTMMRISGAIQILEELMAEQSKHTET